jgi:hypothetical protein
MKKKRSSVWASHALTGSRLPATIALRLSVFGTYHGRNTPTSSRSPPMQAITSLRESRDTSMRAAPYMGWPRFPIIRGWLGVVGRVRAD